MKHSIVATQEQELGLGELGAPLPLDRLLPGLGPWEVEIGFGKGRYLLERARTEPETRFLGIEVARRYHRRVAQRVQRRGLSNVATLCGEALYLLSAVLPGSFARAVHVYFPDPWPKSRHHKRRLFDPETVDLVIGLLIPGGCLEFATDFLSYGEEVRELLTAHPSLTVTTLPGGWPGGPRTHYEAKYLREGRPILRLEAVCSTDAPGGLLHPSGVKGVVEGWRGWEGPV